MSTRSDPPQSGDDVRLVVEGLQAVDPLVTVFWEPRARILKPGRYDVMGKAIDPVCEGLWAVGRYDSFGTAPWRPYTRIFWVTDTVRVGPDIDAQSAHGRYKPLGEWVVTMLKQMDSWNQEWVRRRSAEIDTLNARLEAQRIADGADGIEEAASKQYHLGTKAGGGVSDFHPVRVNLTPR